ncbi:MAG TPA: hypothetical protein VMS12_09025, partial [Thermoanaerobaculia bacterium]|nr:hypothetical protein [Thermoanaerobaculia bacterium]
DGSLLRPPTAIPWPGVAGGSLAWNGRTLLLMAGKKRDTSNGFDLVARTANPDLSTVGEERIVAESLRSALGVSSTDSFVIVYSTNDGIFVVRLSDSGTLLENPVQLSAVPTNERFDVASGPDGTIVVWPEGPDPLWSLRIATIVSGEVQVITPQILPFEGDTTRLFVQPLGSEFVLAWQGVDYHQGSLRGREISWTRINASGEAGAILRLPGLAGGEVLHGAGSNGETVLLAWERHIAGVGTPLFGATVSRGVVSEPKFLSLDHSTVEALDVSSPGDGTTFAAWKETSGIGTTLFAGRWSRDGERLAIQSLRGVEGLLGGISLVSGGGRTLLLWRQGYSILGAWLADDASFTEEPFFVVQRPGPFGRVPELPAASWDGSRFLVVWVELGEVEGAFLSPSGVVTPLGVLASPPPPGPRSNYGIRSVRVASGSKGSYLAAEVREAFFCVGIPCPTTDHIGVLSLGSDGKPLGAVELISQGTSPDVATDGRDFLMSWRNAEGVHTRLVSEAGDSPSVDRLLFAHASVPSTRVVWNGSEYVVAWGGARIHLARVERAGTVNQPLYAIDGFSEFIGTPPAIGSLPGDAFVSWIDRGPENRSVAVAEFLRLAAPLPPPPPAPAGVTVRRVDPSLIDVSWIPVSGATGYWIETLQPDVRGGLRWSSNRIIGDGNADSTRIQVGNQVIAIRIRALGDGGGSEAVEASLLSQRRRVTRP